MTNIVKVNDMADVSGVVAEATNKFALDLHKFLGHEASFATENLFYSPASIFIALAMTCFGTKGKTAAEIVKVLHVASVPTAELNINMKKFLSTVNAVSDNNTKLLVANKLFIEKSLEILESFIEGTREFYNAEVGLVDYKLHAERAREEINQWVEQKTNDKIKDLILPGMLDADTKLTLVNAIYFKGLWLEPFSKEATFPGSFFAAGNQEIRVPMMYQESNFKYTESEELACQTLEMPYVGGKLSMVIFLPLETGGLSSLEEKMTFDSLQKSLSDLDASTPDEIEVYLPKFKLTQRFDLNNILARMGAAEMFAAGKANFTGISEVPLYVSDVVHKAFIDVNEEGTEAAAATGIGMKMMSLKPMFNANHPFLFLIRHVDTGAILFLGRLAKPAAEA